MSTDLVTRLRDERHEICTEAADEILAQKARIAELEELKNGYYDEAAKGWSKFRLAEASLSTIRADTIEEMAALAESKHNTGNSEYANGWNNAMEYLAAIMRDRSRATPQEEKR